MSWMKFFKSLVFTTSLATVWGIYVLYFHLIALYATKLLQWGAYLLLLMISMIMADLFIRKYAEASPKIWLHKVLFWASVPLMSFIGLYGVLWYDDGRWWYAFHAMLYLSSIAPFIMVALATMMYQYTSEEEVLSNR